MRTAQTVMGAALVLIAATSGARQFVPPAGYSGQPGPGVVTPAEPGSPALARVPDATLAARFALVPSYRRAAQASVKVMGAFTVAEESGARVAAAWGRGFLPVMLRLEDGRCFSLSADYNGGTLSNGRLRRSDCATGQPMAEAPAPVPPMRGLRLVGTSWGYSAWVSDGTDTTVVTAPHATSYQPLFTAKMRALAILAANGIDWPGGNVTLVGRIAGKLTIVTLDVTF